MDKFRRKSLSPRASLFFPIYWRNERNKDGSMAVHVVRVYHGYFVKRESNPRAGATTNKTAASLRLRCNSAILAQTHTNISKRTIGACLVSKTFFIFTPVSYHTIILPLLVCARTHLRIAIVLKSVNNRSYFFK